MKNKYLVLSIVSIILIVLDQIVKWYVHSRFHLHESIVVIPDFFNITYVRNYGAAFGFLSESHPTFREIFFLSMPPIALVVIFMLLRSVDASDKWQIYALSSIFGGAIGNYIDRVRFRYVIDYLDFHIYNKYSWPAFNVADSAIVCGVAVLLFLSFKQQTQVEKK